MTYGTSIDVGEVKIQQNQTLVIRLHVRGFLPATLEEHMEDVIAESIGSYITECKHDSLKLATQAMLLTDFLEMEMSCVLEENKNTIRYIHVSKPRVQSLTKQVITRGLPTKAPRALDTLTWTVNLHLEEASAPCAISIAMFIMNEEQLQVM